MKMKKNMLGRILSVLSILLLLFNMMMPMVSHAAAHDPKDETYDYKLRFWEDQQPDIGFYINAAARYTLETVKEPEMGTIAGEWSVMNLLRGMYTGYDYLNYIGDNYFTGYLEQIEKYVKDKNGNLDRNKSTEWSRLILALSALNYDITDVAGYDFIERLSSSHSFSYRQGINGPIWEIIAMNTGDYQFYSDGSNDDINTYGKMIDYILDREIRQSNGTLGGWALANFGGVQPDPDITGMALQALATYYNDEDLYNQTNATTSYEEFSKAVERGIAVLADMQAENGSFKAFGTANTESTVQVVVALTELGIDPLSENVELKSLDKSVSFVTNGASRDGVKTNNMIDALLTFWADGSGSEPGVGGFKHVTSGNDGGGGSGYDVNAMATDQALYGLIAYDRFLKGENPLYDMTDMMVEKGGTHYTEFEAKEFSVQFVDPDGNIVHEEPKSPYGIVEILHEYSMEGREFVSWNTKEDGSGTAYYPAEKMAMPEHDITLYAQFENVEYQIDYETNGGTFTDSVIDTFTVDDEVILPTTDQIEKEDYTFAGWYQSDNFEGESVSHIPIGSYGDKTYYAKWEEASQIDLEAIAAVEEMIENLPSVDELEIADKNAVLEAREAYNNLTDNEQALVSNIDKLISLEEKLEELTQGLSVTTNLENGLVTKADRLTFDLWASDKNGMKISTSDINVTNNEKNVSVNWDDSEKTSYTLNLDLGGNNVKIVVRDTYVLEYNIVREYAEDGDVIGTYTFSLEAITIGIGHIIEPVQLDVIKGEDASAALLRALDEYGFGYSHWPAPSFYLEYITDGDNNIFKTDPSIPDVLKEALNGNYDEDRYYPGELGEFDFNSLSGWMYAVNNTFPNVGFADYYLSDGDVMRVQFTLALGSDLGGGMGADFFDIANKDNLTKKIATINSNDDKKEYLAIDIQREAYEQAIEILHKVNANQSETDNALENIHVAEEETKANKEAAQQVDEQILSLPSIEELTLDDKQSVEHVREAYNQLTKDQQNLVANIHLLEELEEQIQHLETIAKDRAEAKVVEDKIDRLPLIEDLTLDDQQAVSDARLAFDQLTVIQKKYVSNVDKLILAERKIADLIERESSPAQRVENLIDKLPDVEDVTLEDKRDVENVRLTYNALLDRQKEQVSNITKLELLEGKMAEKQKAYDYDEANNLDAQIKALAGELLGLQTFNVANIQETDGLTPEMKEKIESLRAMFYSLTLEQQKLLELKDVFTQIEEKMFELEGKSKEEVAVNRVEMMIDGLPAIEDISFLSDQKWVAHVREAYDDLKDSQQKLVVNRTKLIDLENELSNIDQQYASETAVNQVIAEIDDLPNETEITLEDKGDVEAAREAFEELSEKQQERVSNLDKLVTLETRMKDLEVQEQEDQAAATEVETMIHSLPDVDSLTLEDKDSVLAAQEAFNNLTEDQKQYLSDANKLAAILHNLVERIEQLEDELVPIPVDKSKLESIIKYASSIDTTDNTYESAKALEKAIEEGKAVLSDPKANEKDVDHAIQVIEQALNNLQQKEESNKEQPKEEEKEPLEVIEDGSTINGSHQSDATNKADGNQPNKIPVTATSSYNYMALGLLFLLLGVGLYYIRRKKYMH